MFQALRNRNVALLFSAQVISVMGDLVLFIALPFWIYQLTNSAMATGFMFAALTLPQLLISPVAGVYVDRLDRKRLMIASDLIRAALMLCYLFVNSVEQVWIIYLLAFSESAVSQFFRPSVMAVVPTLAQGKEELTRANAALSSSFAIGELVGPALGGILVAWAGPHAAALFDGGTYVASALLLLLTHIPHRAAATQAAASARQAVAQVASELRQGWTDHARPGRKRRLEPRARLGLDADGHGCLAAICDWGNQSIGGPGRRRRHAHNRRNSLCAGRAGRTIGAAHRAANQQGSSTPTRRMTNFPSCGEMRTRFFTGRRVWQS